MIACQGCPRLGRLLRVSVTRRLLPLIPTGLIVDQVTADPERIVIETRSRVLAPSCPVCGHPSDRVHSRYMRVLGDLPWQGRTVVIHVAARRLRCVARPCSRVVFAERLPGIARSHARRTDRLAVLHRHLGLVLGGESGSRLAARLGIALSADSLLRLVRAGAPPGCHAGPRVLGVDDFAWRRGQRYGTILCDLERGRVVDLLPDRDASGLATWLRQHPGTAIVARDRAGAYADGVRQGAPGAVQVADRWHLLRNVSEALVQALDRHRGVFARVAKTVVEDEAATMPALAVKPPNKLDVQRQHRQHDRDARFAHVADLQRAGLGLREIMRTTGLSRNTVRRWTRAAAAPTWRKGEKRRITDPFLPYLRQRLNQGMRNATQLWREISLLGYAGQVIAVRSCVAALKRQGRTVTTPAPDWRRPTPRRAVRALLSDAKPTDLDARFYTALMTAAPDIARAVEEAAAFATMIRTQDHAALGSWLERNRAGPLSGFAEGIRRDRAAIEAALTLPWSTGPVEGQVNRLKLIKRQGYGRSGLDLLRARLLAA